VRRALLLCLFAACAFRPPQPEPPPTAEEEAARLFDELGPAEALCYLQDLGPTTSLAAALYALDRPLEAAGIYGQLLSDDPLTIHNLGAALHAGGLDAEPVFELALSLLPECDTVFAGSLIGLADYYEERGDSETAERIRAQADYLMGDLR
jgi:tetratricopeptide (TPR) repeat protein